MEMNIPAQVHDLAFEDLFGDNKWASRFRLPDGYRSIICAKSDYGADIGGRNWRRWITEEDMGVIRLKLR